LTPELLALTEPYEGGRKNPTKPVLSEGSVVVKLIIPFKNGNCV